MAGLAQAWGTTRTAAAVSLWEPLLDGALGEMSGELRTVFELCEQVCGSLQEQLRTLSELVDGTSGRMLSPRAGLGAPISLQSWNNQLTVDSVTDPRLKQSAEFLTFNPDSTPELGATCENPTFISSPLVAGDASRAGG